MLMGKDISHCRQTGNYSSKSVPWHVPTCNGWDTTGSHEHHS